MKGFGKMAVCLSLMGRRSRLRRAGRVPGLLSHPVPPLLCHSSGAGFPPSVASWPITAAYAPAVTHVSDREVGGRERTKAELLPHQVSQVPLGIRPRGSIRHLCWCLAGRNEWERSVSAHRQPQRSGGPGGRGLYGWPFVRGPACWPFLRETPETIQSAGARPACGAQVSSSVGQGRPRAADTPGGVGSR